MLFHGKRLKPDREWRTDNNVHTLFRRSRDVTVGFGARVAINNRLRGIGEVTKLAIDSKKKTIQAQLKLIGEPEPILIEIKKYRLERSKTTARLIIAEARASRKWIARALNEFVIGRALPIPAKAAPFLRLLE